MAVNMCRNIFVTWEAKNVRNKLLLQSCGAGLIKGDDDLEPGSIRQIVILIVLLIFSSLFSSAETAFTMVNRHRLRALAEEGNKKAARVLSLVEKPDKMLCAILIGNNIVNLSASSLTTTLAIDLAGQAGFDKNSSAFIGIATGILTFLILIFGEITPKNMATKLSEPMSLFYSGPVYMLTQALTPIIFIVNSISKGVCRLFGVDMNQTQAMTEMELRTIVDVSHEDGVIEEEEKEIINNVFDFGDSVAKDIMLPRIDMVFASIDMSYNELVEIFLEEQYSRLPVYEESKDDVIGILNLKDLFFDRVTHRDEAFDIHRLLRKPFFTYEFQKTSVLMEEMRRRSISFAIVLDEYGSTAGLVTLEDLIEEIVGDIRDEFDADEAEALRRVGSNEYEIEGSMKLDDLNDILGTDIESELYDSVGGHMIELLGHLPEEGETVREGNYLYSVRRIDNNRIDTVYLKLE